MLFFKMWLELTDKESYMIRGLKLCLLPLHIKRIETP